MKRVAIWVCGILACGIFGGLVGSNLDFSNGGFFGFLGGALAFTCARLWLAEAAPKNSK